MNPEQLNAIKERVAKATQGPWEYDEDERGIWNKGGFNYLGTVTLSHNSAEFIAHAREDVPALVAEVERLRQVLEFYAKQENWKRHNTSGPYSLDGGYEAPVWEPSAIEFDEGEKARQALAGESSEH